MVCFRISQWYNRITLTFFGLPHLLWSRTGGSFRFGGKELRSVGYCSYNFSTNLLNLYFSSLLKPSSTPCWELLNVLLMERDSCISTGVIENSVFVPLKWSLVRVLWVKKQKSIGARNTWNIKTLGTKETEILCTCLNVHFMHWDHRVRWECWVWWCFHWRIVGIAACYVFLPPAVFHWL